MYVLECTLSNTSTQSQQGLCRWVSAWHSWRVELGKIGSAFFGGIAGPLHHARHCDSNACPFARFVAVRGFMKRFTIATQMVTRDANAARAYNENFMLVFHQTESHALHVVLHKLRDMYMLCIDATSHDVSRYAFMCCDEVLNVWSVRVRGVSATFS